MNQEEIQQVIPMREPYLWLDEVIAIDDDHIHARKFLDPGLDVFRGHYADFPLFPGALQCEAAFQAAAVLIARTQPVEPGHVPVIARVAGVKFRQMARPGQTLDIYVDVRDRVANVIAMRGRIVADGVKTTELSFAATEAPAPAPV